MAGRRSVCRGTSGFSLIEVIVAATLLAAGVGVLFGAFVSAHRFPKPEVGRSFNVNLAREKLEELTEAVRQDFWELPDMPLSDGITETDSVTLNGVTYDRTYTVNGVAGKDYRKVRITVTSPP